MRVARAGAQERADFLRRGSWQLCLIHGQHTDSFFRRAERTFAPEFVELTKAIRELGCVPGMSSHNGGETLPLAGKFDIAVVNTPINKIAWRMCPCVEQVLGAVRGSSKKIIAMKPLAMGRIVPAGVGSRACREALPLVFGGSTAAVGRRRSWAMKSSRLMNHSPSLSAHCKILVPLSL